MTLPSTGSISLSMVNVELGYSSTAPISLNDTAVRTLAGKPSGAISLSDLRGKSAAAFVNPGQSMTNLFAVNGFRSASFTFNTDGTTTFQGGTGSWWLAVHAGIGSSYWVKVTTHGTAVNTQYPGVTMGVWQHMSAAVTYVFENTAVNNEATGIADVAFSTAGADASIVASYTSAISWDVGKTT